MRARRPRLLVVAVQAPALVPALGVGLAVWARFTSSCGCDPDIRGPPGRVPGGTGPATSFVKSLSRAAAGLHDPDVAVSLRRKPQAPRGRYAPNLWPVWIVAPVALIAAVALGWVIYHYAYDYFAQAAADQRPPKPVNIMTSSKRP